MAFSGIQDVAKTTDYSTQFFVGTVVENQDPLGINRIKVSVPGLFEPSLGAVPWLAPFKFSSFGVGPSHGVYGAPAVGSSVVVVLQNGDVHYPLYLASLYSTKDANPEYKNPSVWGFVDPSGNKLKVSMDSQDWEFTHSSGVRISIDAQGLLQVSCNEAQVNVQGNMQATVGGNATVEIGGNGTIAASGNLTLTGSKISLN